MLLAQLDEDLERGHEAGDLGEAGARDHGGVVSHPVGVVRGAQVADQLVQRVQSGLRELKCRK